MKRFVKVVICALIAVMMLAPTVAMAEDAPVLKSISFVNAKIDGKFSSDVYEYGLTLEDSNITPTIDKYEIKGKGEIFVTYNTDEAKHQNGVAVTLEYGNGTVIYNFNYINPPKYDPNSNNNLARLDCHLGEVYPALSESTTDYKLYIPSDMTEIRLTAVTDDTSAVCEIPSSIKLNADQEPVITVTVTASDATTKVYSLRVKRLNKTMAEVENEMAQPDFVSLVQGELFYQKPEFVIVVCSVAGGIVLLAILIILSKRMTVKISDDDEVEFFATISEEEDTSEE